MPNVFAAAHFNNDDAARKLIEGIRSPDGPVCSHCGSINHAYAVTGRAGLYRCAEPECRKDFTVTTGTVMERVHIPLHKWLMGFYLMSASKKGISAHQLHRALGLDYKSAWFMCHRIREAMRTMDPASIRSAARARSWRPMKPISAPSRKPIGAPRHPSGRNSPKAAVRPLKQACHCSLVERGGHVRSFHPATADGERHGIVLDNINRESRGCTPMKAACTISPARSSRPMKPSPTRTANTSVAT